MCLLMGSIVLLHLQDHSHQDLDWLDQVIKLVQDYLVAGRGCYISGCTGGEVGMGALLLKWALVFFDAVFLEMLLLTFSSRIEPGILFLVPIYYCKFLLEVLKGTDW